MREYRMASAYLALCGTVLLGQQVGIAWGLIECYNCLWMDDFKDLPKYSLPQCLPKFNRDRITKEKCDFGCMTALMYGINNGTVSEENPQGPKKTDRPNNSSSTIVTTQGPLPGSMDSIHKGSSLFRGCSKEKIHPSWESNCRDLPLKNEDVYKFKRVCYCKTNLCNDHFAVFPAPSSGTERVKTWPRIFSIQAWMAIVATTIFGERMFPLISEFPC